MKRFETPEIEVLKIVAQDVITTSDDWWEGENGENDTDWH